MAKQFNNQNPGRQNIQSRTEEERFDEEIKKEFNNNYGNFFRILQSKENYNEEINKLKSFMKSLLSRSDNITTSQLRNIFSVAKKAKKKEDLFVMRPKIAYAYGRAEKTELKKLLFFLDSQIQNINEDSDVKKFQELFEAIIAYHKYYGGKD